MGVPIASVKCPRCSTLVEKPATGSPVCPKCGFGGSGKKPAPAAASAPTASASKGSPYGAPAPMRQPQPGGAPLFAGQPPVPGRLRQVSIGMAIGFGILTFGIYTYMLAFKMSGDLHRRTNMNPNWKLFFWLAMFVPFVGTILGYVLYFKNNKQLNGVRTQMGMKDSWLPFIFLFIPIVNIAAPFIWASNYNEAAQRT